jgi:heat shock protein HslJ
VPPIHRSCPEALISQLPAAESAERNPPTWRLARVTKLNAGLLVAVLTALMASCAYGRAGAGSGTPNPSPPAGPGDGLVGSWVLTDGTGPDGPIQILGDNRITLVIDGTDAGGRAACNLYGGTLTVNGSAVRISALSMTEMACNEPAMSAEAAYLAAIGAVAAWEREGDRLIMTGPDVELTYELQRPVPDEEIVGTTWVLESLIQGPAASSVQGEAFLMLTADGAFTGMTGCRELRGHYIVFGDEIQFTDLGAEGDCRAELEAQDRLVIEVLEGGFTASVDGATLTLSAGRNEGLGLVYRAAPGIE